MKNKISKTYIVGLMLFMLGGIISLQAQTINGHVSTIEKNKIVPLEGVMVMFPGGKSMTMTVTNSDGFFEIHRMDNDPLTLEFSLKGYMTDSVKLTGNDQHIMLQMTKVIQLQETVVMGASQKGILNDKFTLLNTETVTGAGLQKLACCTLGESFENSSSISTAFTDAISGAKRVQLLGLSSIYSQMMAENIPTMRGLASTFGWNYVSGTWLESIQVSKGTSSVINGYESITGQINMEMKKPNNTNPFFLNLYADQTGRYEANLTSAVKVAKNLWTGLLLSGAMQTGERDENQDNFMDQPDSKLINLYNRWLYLGDNGVQSRTGIKFVYETRNGGNISNLNATSPLYVSDILNRNFTLENKTGFPVKKGSDMTIGIITSLTHHDLNSIFGDKTYDGAQNSLYMNVLLNSGMKEKYSYTAGASFIYDNYHTSFLDSLIYNEIPKTNINREEIVPGVFGEITYMPVKKVKVVLGSRLDYNFYYGLLFTPRMNVKYDINSYVTFRMSGGRGFHSSNVIPENLGLLASSRKFDISNLNNLKMEDAWNYGASLYWAIPLTGYNLLHLSFDYYHTTFNNQVIADVDRDKNSVYFYNLNGRSFADVFQADLSVSPFKNFDVYAAFRYNNTQETYTAADGVTTYQKEKPLTYQYRGLVNLSYATNPKRWVFDLTAQLNGRVRLPDMTGYTQVDEWTKPYPVLFAQVTKNSKRFDVYVGAENLLGYTQKNPIIDYQNPFSQNFDSSIIWGPLMGIHVYAGIRLRLGSII